MESEELGLVSLVVWLQSPIDEGDAFDGVDDDKALMKNEWK